MSTPDQIDLSQFDLAALRQLQEQIKVTLKDRELAEMARARAEILQIAQNVGVPLADLIDLGGKKKSSDKGPKNAVAVRYRHPDDSSKTWTGRGRQPKWIAEWVEGGNTIDKLKV
jgi:DNA-binding protein H-NS